VTNFSEIEVSGSIQPPEHCEITINRRSPALWRRHRSFHDSLVIFLLRVELPSFESYSCMYFRYLLVMCCNRCSWSRCAQISRASADSRSSLRTSYDRRVQYLEPGSKFKNLVIFCTALSFIDHAVAPSSRTTAAQHQYNTIAQTFTTLSQNQSGL
jgi:hypothetical protein